MSTVSPAQALRLTLHGPYGIANRDIVLLDYSDPATFKALWLEGLKSGEWKWKVNRSNKEQAEQDEEINLTDPTKQFLIIGNDPPDGILDTKIAALAGINFRSHFTATSWLAAWKVKFSPTKKEVDEKNAIAANTRIAVIDPRAASSATGVTQSLQSIFSASGAGGFPLVPGATVLNAPSLEAIFQWLKPVVPDSRTLAKNAPHLRDLLKSTIWSELVSNREQHHALSNVLGPMILSGKKIDGRCFLPTETDGIDETTKQRAQTDRASLLLRRLLTACGKVSWEDTDSGDNDSQISETGKGLQIFLLDDQAEQGWEDWVKERVPGAAGTMRVSVDPTALVEAIRQALVPAKDKAGAIIGFKNKDARFRLELPGLDGATNPVLLLDLRLFSGKVDDERKFLKDELLPLVNHFTGKPDLAWPGFTEKDSSFQRAKSAVESGTLKPDTDEHYEVLTWLPRVVALADMSLPIILFSSTGRRSLVEPFKTYGNIITSFEKPRLNDLAAFRETTERAFANALEQAIDLAKAGHQIRTVLNLTLNDLTSSKESFKEVKRLEVFHEECRSQDEKEFRVAAFAVGFDSQDNANKTDQYIAENGPRFFEPNALRKVTNKIQGEKQWNDQIAVPLSAALKAGGASAAHVLPFVIVSGESFPVFAESGDPFSLVDPSGMDNVNQELLRLLLEVMLCDTLAWIVPQDIESCHFYGATRMRSILWGREKPSKADVANEISARWKTFVKDEVYVDRSASGNYSVSWPSLRPYSFFGLLNDLFAARANSKKARALGCKITSAYGTTLPKEKDLDAPSGYSYLHSIADIVARLVDISSDNVTWECLEINADLPLKIRGAAGLRSRIVRILNCHRAIDEGDLADGFGYGVGVEHEHDLAGSVVALRLQENAPSLTGKQFLKIVTYVKDDGPSWTHSVRLNNTIGGKSNFRSDANPDAPRPSAGEENGRKAGVTSLEAAFKKGKINEKSPSELLTPQYGSGKNPLIAKTPLNASAKCSIDGQIIDARTPHSKLDPSDRRVSIQESPNKSRLEDDVPKKIKHVDLQEYKIRHFWNEQEYREANIPWHNILGFYVRILENGEILVYAVMWFRPLQSNLIDFIDPNLKAFTDEGKPIGQAWKPSPRPQSSGW